MFDGGDERAEAARANLTVDEFLEWSELNGTPEIKPPAFAVDQAASLDTE